MGYLKEWGPDLDPMDDGVTHINVYSKGRTELGRLLSNFAYTPFNHPMYGTFNSVEGFWYWLATGKCHEQLRELWGFSAKKEGRLHKRVHYPNFEMVVCTAIECKLEQNPHIKTLLVSTLLPLTHYYVKGGHVQDQPQFQWQLDHIEGLRQMWQDL